MIKWRCFKDQVDMVEAMVALEFQGIKGSVQGIKCLQCGTQYLLEDTVIEKVLKVEKMVNRK